MQENRHGVDSDGQRPGGSENDSPNCWAPSLLLRNLSEIHAFRVVRTRPGRFVRGQKGGAMQSCNHESWVRVSPKWAMFANVAVPFPSAGLSNT